MKCANCGNELKPGAGFCSSCGAPAPAAAPTPAPAPIPTPAPTVVVTQKNDGLDYTPIGMWGYFGYELLFSIPCIGFIFLLVFALGGTKNVNLRNFARSYFCFVIIIAIIVAILAATGAFAAITSSF